MRRRSLKKRQEIRAVDDTLAANVESAAVAYAERGWSVIPIEPGGKRPLVAWEEFQRRIAAVDEIDDWFWRWSRANVAIVTGSLSRLVVLDIDPGHGGAESLAELEELHGPLPRTIKASTGSGGLHVYFRHPGGVVRNRVGVLPGVDLRGDGGYVVAPPSIHPCGAHYAWATAHAPGDVALAPLPPWLLAVSAEHEHYAYARQHWRELARSLTPVKLEPRKVWVRPRSVQPSSAASSRTGARRRNS